MASASIDPLEMRVEGFAKYWPRFLREELASVGTNRVRDLLQLTPLDIICARKGSRGLLQAIESECQDLEVDGSLLGVFLGRQGTSRPIQPAAPFEQPWGCVYIVDAPAEWGSSSEEAKDVLAGQVVRHFERLGFRTTHGAMARTDEEVETWKAPPRPVPVLGDALTDEDVLLTWDGGLGLAVLRRQQEMAVITHPLAVELSSGSIVVSLRNVPGGPIEIAMVRDGKPLEIDPSKLLRSPMETLGISTSMLMEARTQPRRFCALLGVGVRGFASTVSWLAEVSGHGSERLVGSELRRAIDTHFGPKRVLHFDRF